MGHLSGQLVEAVSMARVEGKKVGTPDEILEKIDEIGGN